MQCDDFRHILRLRSLCPRVQRNYQYSLLSAQRASIWFFECVLVFLPFGILYVILHLIPRVWYSLHLKRRSDALTFSGLCLPGPQLVSTPPKCGTRRERFI